jgi:hypothetical protein
MGEGLNGANIGDTRHPESSGVLNVASAAQAEEAEIAVFAAPGKTEYAHHALQVTAPRRAPQPV